MYIDMCIDMYVPVDEQEVRRVDCTKPDITPRVAVDRRGRSVERQQDQQACVDDVAWVGVEEHRHACEHVCRPVCRLYRRVCVHACRHALDMYSRCV